MGINAEDLFGEAILWAARLIGLFLIFLLVRHFVPTLFFKGWSRLRPEFNIDYVALPANLNWHPTSLRVGTDYYNQTAHLALDTNNAYVQRPALGQNERSTLCLPFERLKLVSPPGPSGPLGLPVYGIFEIGGVQVWVDSPYAEQIITCISTL